MSAKSIFTVLILIFGFNQITLSEEIVDVIKAEPTAKYQVSSEEASKIRLSKSESEKNTVWIVKKSGEYYWKSRENRKLNHVSGGLYHYFIDPQGGGYVKVEQGFDGKVEFLEHVGVGMTTFTYFGKAKSFIP